MFFKFRSAGRLILTVQQQNFHSYLTFTATLGGWTRVRVIFSRIPTS